MGDINSTGPITEKQSDNHCSTQSTDTHDAAQDNAMTGSGPKSRGKNIMRPGLTGSLLRMLGGATPRRPDLTGKSHWVLLIYHHTWRQLHPRVTATVVYGILRRRKAWLGERANGYGDPLAFISFFGVKHR